MVFQSLVSELYNSLQIVYPIRDFDKNEQNFDWLKVTSRRDQLLNIVDDVLLVALKQKISTYLGHTNFDIISSRLFTLRPTIIDGKMSDFYLLKLEYWIYAGEFTTKKRDDFKLAVIFAGDELSIELSQNPTRKSVFSMIFIDELIKYLFTVDVPDVETGPVYK